MTVRRRITDMEKLAGAADKHPRDMTLQELHAACVQALHEYPQHEELRRAVVGLEGQMRKAGLYV